MSLAEAVLEIAGEMEKYFVGGGNMDRTIREFAKQLRTAVKAAGIGVKDLSYSPVIEAAAKKSVKEEETGGERMVVCIGGNADGDYIQISNRMPQDAYTSIGGQTYQLGPDGRLHYQKEVEGAS